MIAVIEEASFEGSAMLGAMPSLPASLAGRLALALALSVVACSAGPVCAQEPAAAPPTDVEDTADEPDVDTAEGPDAAAPPERSSGDPSADELPDDASSGPSLVERQAAARRGEVIGRPSGPDPNDPDLPVSMLLMLGGGGVIDPSSLDLALRSHDYGTPGGFFAGDVSITGRVLDWLWLGGRFGGRGRFYTRNDGPGGSAGAFDLMAVVQTRFQLGRIVEIGVMAGAGAALVGVLLRNQLSAGVWPRLTAGVHIGMRIAHGVRIVARFSWDYCTIFDIDRYGSDVELGGPAGAIGIEVRS
jgi:hypothetical protein